MIEPRRTCLVIGATGFIGSAVCAELRRAGYEVSGVARSSEAQAVLRAAGVTPVPGDLEDRLAAVLAAAARHDVVVYAAQLLLEPEHAVVAQLLEVTTGPDQTFVFTSGAGVLGQRTGGAWSEDTFAEDDPFVPSARLARRVDTETLVRSHPGCRAMVVRPPLVWGPGDRGHMALIYESVGRTGSACYVGEGLNLYSHVHVDDLARLYARILESGVQGALYHAVAGEVPNRWIAEAVARDMGCETRSVTMDEAMTIWSRFAVLIILGVSSRSRSPRAKAELTWSPRHTDMLSMIGAPHLRQAAALARDKVPSSPLS